MDTAEFLKTGERELSETITTLSNSELATFHNTII